MNEWTSVTGSLAFDDAPDWENDLSGYLQTHERAQPWTRGSHGKFVVTPGGKFESWATNAMGEPHHDAVADERGLGQVLKGDIAPSGAWWVTDVIDPRVNADEVTQQVAPQAQKAGLRPVFRGYAAKVAVKSDICDRCLNHYADCTCAPSDGGWATEPIADPVRDLKGPVQAAFQRVIPEHRWTS